MDNYRIVTVEGECFNIKQLLNQLEEKIKAYCLAREINE